jgi:hypothetical protein
VRPFRAALRRRPGSRQTQRQAPAAPWRAACSPPTSVKLSPRCGDQPRHRPSGQGNEVT